MSDMIWIWLGLVIVFMVVEAATVGLTSIWFAAGALAALISSLFKAPLWLQIVWFIVVSAVMLFFTRPFAKKYIDSRKEHTNADRFIGQVGVVTVEIDNLKPSGMVFVNGRTWSARSISGAVIEEGREIKAVSIEGVKLMVEPVVQIEKEEIK